MFKTFPVDPVLLTALVIYTNLLKRIPSCFRPATGEASPQDDLVEEEDALMEHHIHENGMDHVNNINMNNINGNVMVGGL